MFTLKKIVVISFVLLFVCHPAAAKLKNKTVATPQPAPEKTDQATLGYDKGLYFKTEGFTLKAKVMAKIRYLYEYVNDFADSNTVALRMGRVDLSGYALDDKLNFRIMWGFDNNAAASLLDLYIDYKFSEALQIRMGQWKVPFSREYISQPFNLFMADWTDIVNYMGLNRDIGVDLHGAFADKHVEYDLYAFNGNGRAVANSNKSIYVGTRINFNLLGRPGPTLHDIEHSESPQWAVGFAAVYDLGSDLAAISGNELIRATADTVIKYRGFTFETEGHYQFNTVTHDGNFGIGGQTNIFVVPKRLALGAHADMILRDDAGALGDGNVNTWDVGSAIDFFIDADRFKFILDYTFYKNFTGVPGMEDHQFILQGQIYY
ncbi:MAG: hypothetical protein HQM16_02730 [Deltaproteobacteria bacterium]|nr:hypothetical protein [Deltaproteobacteria bacterium]